MIGDFLLVFVSVLFDIMNFAILARVLLSWFPGANGGQIKALLIDITDPILGVFKKIIPPIGMIDISPIIAILALNLVQTILVSIIRNVAF